MESSVLLSQWENLNPMKVWLHNNICLRMIYCLPVSLSTVTGYCCSSLFLILAWGHVYWYWKGGKGEGGRNREGEKHHCEKHWSVAFSMHGQRSNLKPRQAPWSRNECMTFHANQLNHTDQHNTDFVIPPTYYSSILITTVHFKRQAKST